MALSAQEREQFLAEPHIGALAVDAGPGRAPLTVPVWYDYEPGGELWLLTGAESKKIELIKAAGRFGIMAERQEPSVRYVNVEGPVTRITPATDEQHLHMVRRYLPEEKVEAYLRVAAELGEQVVVAMRPEHWYSADLGAL
ncbi:pyridoxamine 5'-phosphate oxidase family protein [Nocardia sp. CDC159]|uniref:Pyridoxamine 5'-phosphate oxidase family protein n=1 Tax=Nocardia pulmonis TaxID=2951408 RepID=A0A9X2IW13_9NOCA|nr:MULTISPECIES: pyridoxamine 5'-phosphate oxidase family protein [Nocardia]MCM6772360.1 pyridoxamine 5'-phosphate oxidase family protein [Nocardia pulmonis]MCM6784982.1 pyridoxamine 5'-phosphate oxidase family protein [Nocardia sp. CDC159]